MKDLAIIWRHSFGRFYSMQIATFRVLQTDKLLAKLRRRQSVSTLTSCGSTWKSTIRRWHEFSLMNRHYMLKVRIRGKKEHIETLRGPVNTVEEKRLIGEISERIAHTGNVDNQLEVKLTASNN